MAAGYIYSKASIKILALSTDVNDFLELFCPTITSIVNGIHTCTREARVGSICKFGCIMGHELDPPDHPGWLCYKHGVWVGPELPVCRNLQSNL